MSDADERQLARTAMATLATSDVDRLKAAWARSLEWRECKDSAEDGSGFCGAHVPLLAWERHVRRHAVLRQLERSAPGAAMSRETPTGPQARTGPIEAAEAAAPRRRGPFVPIPNTGAIAMRLRKSPLWHRLIVQPGQQHVRFFSDPGGQITFIYGDHRGSMPPGTHYFAYGVSLAVDMDTHAESAFNVYTSGVVQFVIGPSILADWPARLAASDSRELRTFLADEIMADPTSASGFEAALDMLTPARSLTVSNRPVKLGALEAWSLDLFMPEPVTKPTGIMGVVHGIGVRGISS